MLIRISRISAFSGLDKPRMLYFLLINVKMPTIVDILIFMSRKISCSAELSMKKNYLLGARRSKSAQNSVVRLTDNLDISIAVPWT